MSRATLALWRFDEVEDDERSYDAQGNVAELDIADNLTRPPVIDAVSGRGRRFLAASSRGLVAQDVVGGTTFAQRDLTVQAIVWWDLTAQNTYGSVGTIYARGKSHSTAERISAALELRVVDVATRLGEIRWRWQNAAGTQFAQPGGYFVASVADYQLLTATRRWVSSSEVVVRYYLGDQLLAEHTSVDGSIGGGTTGTTQIGARWTGAVYANFFDGVIDEMRVLDYELTAEEIESTWKRITVHQPRGYELFRELHDPGFPISDSPDSRVQKETRWLGNALGTAAAIGHDIADNALPDRAYGPALEAWEEAYKPVPTPRQGDSTDQRRARVIGRMRQRRGFSMPGVLDAISELADTHRDNLAFVGFSQTTTDTWATLNPTRWTFDPSAQWAAVAGNARATVTAVDIPFTGTAKSWYSSRMSIGGRGRAVQMVAKISLNTWAANGEAGVWLGDWARGDLLLVGLRYSGGNVEVRTEFFKAWASAGSTVRFAAFAWPGWLIVKMNDAEEALMVSAAPTFTIGHAATELGPYTKLAGIASPSTWSLPYGLDWAGHYVRTVGGAATLQIDFGKTIVRAPYGERAHRWYVYRDPVLGGEPDFEATNQVLRGLKHAHTEGRMVNNLVAKFDDPDSLFDGAPLGGI